MPTSCWLVQPLDDVVVAMKQTISGGVGVESQGQSLKSI